MERPTPIKDAAVHRLAKSITQLTLCQVTTSEVDDATKLLEKARQLQGIQNIPSQRVNDLEAAIRQLRQICCILDSCTISARNEVTQAQKAIAASSYSQRSQYGIGRTQCAGGSRGAPFGEGTLSPLRRYLKPLPKGGRGGRGGVNEEPKPP